MSTFLDEITVSNYFLPQMKFGVSSGAISFAFVPLMGRHGWLVGNDSAEFDAPRFYTSTGYPST